MLGTVEVHQRKGCYTCNMSVVSKAFQSVFTGNILEAIMAKSHLI